MTNKIQALIIEDEIQSDNTLRLIVNEYCPNVEIVGHATSVKEAIELTDSLRPQLLFLDVEIQGGTAFDVLVKIEHKKLNIIFITAYDSYALQAIKYSAIDYLLKPIDIEELKNAIGKLQSHTVGDTDSTIISQFIDVLKNNARNPSSFIPIPFNDGFSFIPISEIVRLEASGSYTYIFVNGKDKILASKNLKEYESMLPEDTFIRVHNSHLLNKAHIRKYVKGSGGYCIMSDGTTVSIATRKKEWILRMMGIGGAE